MGSAQAIDIDGCAYAPLWVGAKPRRWLREPPSSRSITTKVRGSWPDAMYCFFFVWLFRAFGWCWLVGSGEMQVKEGPVPRGPPLDRGAVIVVAWLGVTDDRPTGETTGDKRANGPTWTMLGWLSDCISSISPRISRTRSSFRSQSSFKICGLCVLCLVGGGRLMWVKIQTTHATHAPTDPLILSID